jgi:CDGSH-type Zn-finger protein
LATHVSDLTGGVLHENAGINTFTYVLKGSVAIMADDTKPSIMAEKDGPLYIQNAKGLILLDSDGNPFEITDDEITLCRCGQSRNKPFCDDSHVRTGFKSEVKAPQKP